MSLEKTLEQTNVLLRALLDKLSGQQELALEVPKPETKVIPIKEQPTKDDVMKSMADFAKSHSNKEAKAIFTQLGFKGMSELPEDKYAQVIRMAS